MKWLIAGVLFTLAVGLAVGTASIRAQNVVARRNVEQEYRAIADRRIEHQRLCNERLRSLAPERLAELQLVCLQQAIARQEQMQ
jgi:hypothetical protein